MKSFFPYSSEIEIGPQLTVNYKTVLKKIGPLLTAPRREKIKKVVARRFFSTAIVLEGIYDRGNTSAVMRSAEAMGFAHFHVIETQEKFKESHRVTKGADKWLEIKKWKNSKDSINYLKQQGFQICVTSLEGACPIQDVDFTKPSALVLGNEKDGVSKEMMDAADVKMMIPMTGFVQSFNISVAGALCLYHIYQQRYSMGTDLSNDEKGILEALYYMRTLDSATDYLRELELRNGEDRHEN